MVERQRAPLAATSSVVVVPVTAASSMARSVPIGVNTSLSGVTVSPSSSARVLLPPMPIWVQPATQRQSPRTRTRTRPRARTSSERGQLFRQRQKQYVDELKASIQQLQEQISQLSIGASITSLAPQRSVSVRTDDWGSLVQLTREFYTVFRHGLEAFDPTDQRQEPVLKDIQATAHRRASSQYKEGFLRQVVDPNVKYGSLVGVDALITQWLQHTASYSQLDIELGRAECIVGDDDNNTNSVVMIQTQVHAQFSHESLLIMFPFAKGREDLIEVFTDRDLTFECVSWFEFSEIGRVITYNVQFNYVEALVVAVGSARLVAELMELSVMTPDSVLMPPEHRSLEAADGYTPMAVDRYRGSRRRSRSLGMNDYLSDSSELETKGEEEDGYCFADHRRYSGGFASTATVFFNSEFGYEDVKEDDEMSHVMQL